MAISSGPILGNPANRADLSPTDLKLDPRRWRERIRSRNAGPGDHHDPRLGSGRRPDQTAPGLPATLVLKISWGHILCRRAVAANMRTASEKDNRPPSRP